MEAAISKPPETARRRVRFTICKKLQIGLLYLIRRCSPSTSFGSDLAALREGVMGRELVVGLAGAGIGEW